VLVHGSLDRAASFARVARRLPELDVVAYDRRGYSRSRALEPRAETLDDHVADLFSVLDGREAVVVGHSLGGDVAMAAAARAPAQIPAVGAWEPPLPWLEWWPRRARAGADEDPAAFAEAFFRRIVGHEAWDRLPERTRAARRAEGPALLAEILALRTGAPPFDLAAFPVPLVVGRGGASLDHHRRAADAIAALRPGTVVVEIEGAGHGAHRSHPAAFADFVRRAIAARPARER